LAGSIGIERRGISMNGIEGVREELSGFTNKAVEINGKGLQQITRDEKHPAHRLKLYRIRETLERNFINHKTFIAGMAHEYL